MKQGPDLQNKVEPVKSKKRKGGNNPTDDSIRVGAWRRQRELQPDENRDRRRISHYVRILEGFRLGRV